MNESAHVIPSMKDVQGFVKYHVCFCKTEWAYQTECFFDNLSDLNRFMAAEGPVSPAMRAKMEEIGADMGSLHVTYIHDEFE